MNKKKFWTTFFVAICLCHGAFAEKSVEEKALENALVYLTQQQNTDGSWGSADAHDKIKATATVYNTLTSMNTLSVPAGAAESWLKNARGRDLEDKAHLTIATPFFMDGSLSDHFKSELLYGAYKAYSRLTGEEKESAIASDLTLSLWGAFEGYTHSTIDTALALRALLKTHYANEGYFQRAKLVSGANYLIKKRNKGTENPKMGSGWGFSSDDYSDHFASKVIPTAHALLLLTEEKMVWNQSVEQNALEAAHWLVSKQYLTGKFGDASEQGNDTATVLATLAFAQLIKRESDDALVNQAYTKGKNYLATQLIAQGHISGSALLTALAMQALPFKTIEFVDKDRDGVPDAIESRLDLDADNFDAHKLIKGNGLLGDVLSLAQKTVPFALGEAVHHRIVDTNEIHFSVLSGRLPDGLEWIEETALIKGTPKRSGVYHLSCQIRLQDNSKIANLLLQIHVMEPDKDHDGDGIPSAYEINHQLDPLSQADGALDGDLDGQSNLEEFLNSTNPLVSNLGDSDGDQSTGRQKRSIKAYLQQSDTDGDSLGDEMETDQGRDPLVNEPVLLQMTDL